MQGLYIEETGMHLEVERGKLTAKIPMKPLVIDENGRIFKYFIKDKKVQYLFCGCIFIE